MSRLKTVNARIKNLEWISDLQIELELQTSEGIIKEELDESKPWDALYFAEILHSYCEQNECDINKIGRLEGFLIRLVISEDDEKGCFAFVAVGDIIEDRFYPVDSFDDIFEMKEYTEDELKKIWKENNM